MKISVEIMRILELTKVLSSPLSIFPDQQPLLSESFVVGLIEMHPNDKYFTYVLSTSYCVMAQERKTFVFYEVLTYYRLVHNNI